MFRKPKKSTNKAGLRQRRKSRFDDDDDDEVSNSALHTSSDNDNDDDNDDHETTIELLQVARKRAKLSGTTSFQTASVGVAVKSNNNKNNNKESFENNSSGNLIMHQYQASSNETISHKDLATSTNEYHPIKENNTMANKTGIQQRNKFLAGPIRAPTNIRTTCRFDYQPDICKDYKETGFCGFGDTCIYLHDRGDTMSGWQLEQKWEQEQAKKKKEQERQMEAFMSGGNVNEGTTTATLDDEAMASGSDGDGLPFACFVCRKAFDDPVVTPCGHYFCQSCLHQHNKVNDNQCPVCKKDTHGVMNQPTKLLNKKRKLLGRNANATWQEFMDHAKTKT